MASYPPCQSETAPSVREMIGRGYKTRVLHKSRAPTPTHSPPKPARPGGPKVNDVSMSARAMRMHHRCMRKHNVAMTDRMAHLARPARRYVIARWRDNANTLPPQAINRFRNFLDADEPFKPDQAYQFFVNMRKGKKANKGKPQKELRAMCGDRRYVWARKATVAFARGIEQRLSKPVHPDYNLQDAALRLSNIILGELCCLMRMHVPPRRTRHPKSKFVIEMADKVAVWIEEILGESEDRMLMMDFDEDDDFDEFLSMMAGDGPGGGKSVKPQPAYTTSQEGSAEKILGQLETPEERQRRLAAEKLLGRPETPEEMRARLEAEKRLGRPETPEEMRQRLAAMAGALAAEKLLGRPETPEERERRFAAEKLLGRPETEAEMRARLEAEKRLGRPETPEEMRQRLAAMAGLETEEKKARRLAPEKILGEAEKRLGRPETPEEMRQRPAAMAGPETEEEKARRLAAEKILGRPETPEERQRRLAAEKLLGRPETEAEMRARLEAEKRLGRPETPEEMKQRLAAMGGLPETEEEKSRRLAAEKILGRPETPEERQRRLEAEKRLGRAETEEEMKQRLAAKQAAALANETEEEKARRIAAEKILGRPETPEERQRRLVAEKLLGRPETEAEMKARLAAEKLLGRPETEEEMRQRLEAEKRLGRPETPEEMRQRLAAMTGPETEEEKARRLAAEKILGRPETSEERQRRLAAEKLLGRPETEAEMRARLEAEKRLGRPETPEEMRQRLAAMAGPETEEEKTRRLAAEKILGRPETPEERQRRLAAEKLLGRPETEAEMKARLEAEKLLGRPETPKEMKPKLAATGGALAAQKLLGRPETPEELKRRLAAEKLLGRPETEAEMRARLEAEKRLGRPETPEEMRQRLAAMAGPPETEEEKARRLAAEKILGRPETPEERQRRLEVEKRLGRPETEEEMRQRLAAEALQKAQKEATEILHKQLRDAGKEILHEQSHPRMAVTHIEAESWLNKPPVFVEKSVKDAGDTAWLSEKLEKKLGKLVSKVTPANLEDVMQDVVIENSVKISEFFVAKSYRTTVENMLIAQMQKKGQDIIVGVDGAAETYFFAAQRLKRAFTRDAGVPRSDVAYKIRKKLDSIIRCCAIQHNILSVMKNHVKDSAMYLSGLVTMPDPEIEAYITLLDIMEDAGNEQLIDWPPIKKSYKEAANYLRQLTSFEDKINMSDDTLLSSIEGKLNELVTSKGSSTSAMKKVISENAKLLSSYIVFLGTKTATLCKLTKLMKEEDDSVLLRHGTVLKTFRDGADVLHNLTADQLEVKDVEPVVCRKIQIKLENFKVCQPLEHLPLIDDVIEDVTMYLAVALLRERRAKVCKCMKKVFVQCDKRCEELLRQLSKSNACQVCSRKIEASALKDLIEPGVRLLIGPGRAMGPSVSIELKPCSGQDECSSSSSPGTSRTTTNYMVYGTSLDEAPTRLHPTHSIKPPTFDHEKGACSSKMTSTHSPCTTNSTWTKALIKNPRTAGAQHINVAMISAGDDPYVASTSATNSTIGTTSTRTFTDKFSPINTVQMSSIESTSHITTNTISEDQKHMDSFENSSAKTSTITTEEMPDWHALLVSLMWNVQAWRRWLQDNIDRGLNYRYTSELSEDEVQKFNWIHFQRQVCSEALRWQKYNDFSRQLTTRIAARYQDKEIWSPGYTANKTRQYQICQSEMFNVIRIFKEWTRMLMNFVQEAAEFIEDRDGSVSSNYSLQEACWNYYQKKVEAHVHEWKKHTFHLKVDWEQKYCKIISEWQPRWQQSGPAWVVSANGVVPSGAVAAGQHHGELVWLARTTHRSTVYPAAVIPSQQCCVVHADGKTHLHSKYQVMCNASVKWVQANLKSPRARAVRVAADVYAGRVCFRGSHLVGAVRPPAYRCHIIVMGRAFAFEYYELLVLDDDQTTSHK